MKAALRPFCYILDHNWRLVENEYQSEVLCARCGLKRDRKIVPAWYHKGGHSGYPGADKTP